MLQQLTIRNYALIEALTLQPGKRLNVITGETGAGKSIILGAVALLLGERADTKVLCHKDKKCIIEGIFDVQAYGLANFFQAHDLDYEAATTLRREITPAGKSRALINDTPVTLPILKVLANRLVNIHSQYHTLFLGYPKFQLQLIDWYAGNEALKASYATAFHNFKTQQSLYGNLVAAHQQSQASLDYNQFLFNELKETHFQVDEQAQLTERLQLLENAETIKTKLHEVLNGLDQAEMSASERLATAQQILRQLIDISEKYHPLQQRIESCCIELQDIITELAQEADEVHMAPSQLEETRNRLNTLYRLQQKHQVQTIEALHAIEAELEAKVNKAAHLEEEIAPKKKAMDNAATMLLAKATALSTARKNIFSSLKNNMQHLLGGLGMPDAQLSIHTTSVAPHATGIDVIEILFSANKGIAPQPLGKIASGGECARLMFCFQFIIADKTAMPTIIFDEIDTGISGEIALKMAHMMKKMANNHQLMTITHLPQIAAKGDQHYLVYKATDAKTTVSKVKKLLAKERVLALAQMIGGHNPSPIMLENARELLAASSG